LSTELREDAALNQMFNFISILSTKCARRDAGERTLPPHSSHGGPSIKPRFVDHSKYARWNQWLEEGRNGDGRLCADWELHSGSRLLVGMESVEVQVVGIDGGRVQVGTGNGGEKVEDIFPFAIVVGVVVPSGGGVPIGCLFVVAGLK
jgi:hypothetical protein